MYGSQCLYWLTSGIKKYISSSPSFTNIRCTHSLSIAIKFTFRLSNHTVSSIYGTRTTHWTRTWLGYRHRTVYSLWVWSSDALLLHCSRHSVTLCNLHRGFSLTNNVWPFLSFSSANYIESIVVSHLVCHRIPRSYRHRTDVFTGHAQWIHVQLFHKSLAKGLSSVARIGCLNKNLTTSAKLCNDA